MSGLFSSAASALGFGGTTTSGSMASNSGSAPVSAPASAPSSMAKVPNVARAPRMASNSGMSRTSGMNSNSGMSRTLEAPSMKNSSQLGGYRKKSRARKSKKTRGRKSKKTRRGRK